MKSNTYMIKNRLTVVFLFTAFLFLVDSFAGPAYADSKYPQITESAHRQINTLQDLNAAFIDIVAAVKPTVVTVSTERTMAVPASPFGNDPLFQYFFGQDGSSQGREYHQRGLGSGVIVSDDGYVMTNNHVIADADSIYVRTFDGKRYNAHIIGADEQTDIAVLKIDETGLPYIEMGNSDNLQVGEMVLAIGSPMSEHLAYSVTQGIVSAVGRSDMGLADYENFIQTDAAINPGNSGGPLINLEGKLIGINTAIVSHTGGFQGIGFAVPVNMAMHVMNSLIAEGRVVRGWLGVSVQDLNDDLAEAMGTEKLSGALIGDVVDDGPADKAGLKSGDIIVAMDGQEIKSSSDLRNRIALSVPETEVDLTAIRNGKEIETRVKLGELGSELAQNSNSNEVEGQLGLTLTPLTPDFRSNYGISDKLSGVGIAAVEQGGKAFQAGLKKGDVIQSVNRKQVSSPQEFDQSISKLKSGDMVLLRDYRDGYSFFIAFSI